MYPVRRRPQPDVQERNDLQRAGLSGVNYGPIAFLVPSFSFLSESRETTELRKPWGKVATEARREGLVESLNCH